MKACTQSIRISVSADGKYVVYKAPWIIKQQLPRYKKYSRIARFRLVMVTLLLVKQLPGTLRVISGVIRHLIGGQ